MRRALSVKALLILALALLVFGAGGYFTYEMFIHPKKALEEEKLRPPEPPRPILRSPIMKKPWPCGGRARSLKRATLSRHFVEHNPQSTKIDDAKELLGDINTTIFLSPIAAPEKEVYIVKKGDVVSRVAKAMHTSVELLLRANNLQNSMLRIGQKLTVSPGDFSLLISRKSDKVVLLEKGHFFKQYRHSLMASHPGKEGGAGSQGRGSGAQAGREGGRKDCVAQRRPRSVLR